ncbi:MAG TPA: hypothetical protein PLX62_07075 [Bacteroidales bacterium]|jgi:hypothetical protein|nr:hypothetical protein [Sphaerochaeta sp.]HQB52652.1 hypothetical protein [Bacteroidales bacterium]
MKKLRIVATLSVAIAMVFALGSCSKSSSQSGAPAQAATVQTQVPAAPTTVVEKPAAPAKELTIEEKLIADQWCFKFSVEGYGEYSFFFKFYEEDPVLGKVFYAGLSNNRVVFAGTYKVVERDYEYTAYKNREDEQAETNEVSGTAKYTVIFYDWEGNINGRVGFDGEKLINAQDKTNAVIYSTGSTPYFYEKNTGAFDAIVAGELPVAVFEFVADEDVTSTIKVNHNHTYTDLVNAMVEGTWIATQADGAITFRLTPNDKTDTPATLAVSADKLTAVYTADGEASINMSVPKPAVTVEHTFEGTAPTSYGRDANLSLELMSDGTCILTSTIFGNSGVMDQGKWSVDHAYKFTIEFEKVGILVSEIIDRVIHLQYKQDGHALGDIVSDLIRK